jgi:hypothetical protein
MPFKRDADREHYLEAFRRAGLDWLQETSSQLRS